MENLTIVKIGGGVLEDQKELNAFLDQFVSMEGKKLLVHGGGRLATKVMDNLGIPSRMVDGRRITDKETLDVVTMVYAGLVSKKAVAALQSRSCNAIGLCGADAAVIISKKRIHTKVEYGFVGDIESIDHDLIIRFLSLGLVPVFSPITMNPDGQLLNTNADHIASALAVSLSCCYLVTLIYCFEKPGVLSRPEDEQSLIPEINLFTYNALKSNSSISNGMIPKLDNCYHALANGVERVFITNGKGLKQNAGTKVCL